MLWGVVYGQVCADEDTVRSNTATMITYNSARINGTTAHMTGAVTSIQLKYVRVGLTDTVTSSGLSALRNITGLQASTQYYYYYKTICGSGTQSQTIGAYTFTTLANTIIYADERPTRFHYVYADSLLQIGAVDTSLYRAPTHPSIVYKSSDDTYYGYHLDCSCWQPLAIDSSGIIALLDDKVDSVTVSGDSLFYWKVGVSYGYILPSVATVWHTTGNAGIDTSTDFIGTTDNVDFPIKTNDVRRFTVNTSGSLGIGATPDYGTSGYVLQSAGNAAAPTWSAYTWQKALTAGSTLTGNNTINGGDFDLTIEDVNEFLIGTTGAGSYTQIGSSDWGNASYFRVESDSIHLQPHVGNFHIDTLNNASTQNQLMGWTSSGGDRGGVGYITVGSGLSLSGGALTSTAGSLTSTYIGYGSAGNALTGDANLTYTAASSAVVIDSGYLSFTGHKAYGSTVAGSIFKHSDYGLTTRAIAGTTYDWLMFSTGGNTVLANPTGTDNFLTSGRWGFGSLGLTPTAKVHIAAGSATANTAPLQLTTGPVETVARAGVMEYTTPQLFFTNGAAVRQELFQGQQARVSTQYDNTTTTLGNVTGLTANVAAGKVYRFEANLYTTSDVAGGIKVAIGGTATATTIIYEGLTTNAGLTTQSRSTALGTAVGAVTAVTAAYVTVTGTITVNAAGTLTVQAAANAATGTTSVLVGSTFVITEIL